MKGTPFSQSRNACQWMRNITPTVSQGMRNKALSSAREDQAAGLPEIEVSNNWPSASA